MSTLAIMPFFLIMYVRGLTPSEASAEGPVAAGAELFGGCASCHGADGGGGAGRQLSEGDVLITFPKIEWQLNLVYTGSQVHAGEVYGDPNREGGPHIGLEYNGSPMPQQGAAVGGALTDAEILAVVCHERYDLPGNADPTSAEWVGRVRQVVQPGERDLRRSGRRQLDLRRPGARHRYRADRFRLRHGRQRSAGLSHPLA